MYLNRISISGKKMERLVVNLSEECPFRWPFRAEGACLSPNLREAYNPFSERQYRPLQQLAGSTALAWLQ